MFSRISFQLAGISDTFLLTSQHRNLRNTDVTGRSRVTYLIQADSIIMLIWHFE